jgi:hypothetical protein
VGSLTFARRVRYVTNEHEGKVRGAQLCKTSKAGAASVSMVRAKMGQPLPKEASREKKRRAPNKEP